MAETLARGRARAEGAAGPLARLASGELDRGLLLGLVGLYVGLLCLLPLLRLGQELLIAGQGGIVSEVLAARSTRRALWNTLEAALLSTALAVALGAAYAILTALFDLRGRALAALLFLLPLLVPAQIAAMAWLQLASPSSPILGLLGLAPEAGARNPLHSREGVILLLALEHATLPFLAVRAGLAAIPGELLEAARIAGARPPRVLWTVRPVGFDNEYVLTHILGKTESEIRQLYERGAVGKWAEIRGRRPPPDWDGKAGLIMVRPE